MRGRVADLVLTFTVHLASWHAARLIDLPISAPTAFGIVVDLARLATRIAQASLGMTPQVIELDVAINEVRPPHQEASHDLVRRPDRPSRETAQPGSPEPPHPWAAGDPVPGPTAEPRRAGRRSECPLITTRSLCRRRRSLCGPGRRRTSTHGRGVHTKEVNMHRRALVLTLLAVLVVLAHPVLAHQDPQSRPPLHSAASDRLVIFEAFMRPG